MFVRRVVIAAVHGKDAVVNKRSTTNTAGLAGQNRLGVGLGGQTGRRGKHDYQRIIGNQACVSPGAAFSGNEQRVMGGAGFRG